MNTTNSIQKKAVALVTCAVLSFGGLFADWNPEYLANDEGVIPNETAMCAPNFLELKAKVSKFLVNSWCSQEKANLLMDLVLVTQPKVCVEIGACTGSSVLPVAATLKYLGKGQVFAIDAWSNAEAVKNWEDNDPNKPWWSKVDMKTLQKHFQNMVSTWNVASTCKTLCMPSDKAVSQVPNNIDFLHLDGDYSEKGSMQDIELYLPKVQSGGYILLSGLFTMVNNKQPKLKAFCTLFDSCDIVAEIERDNAVLFKKK
jgi:hypothetical protein